MKRLLLGILLLALAVPVMATSLNFQNPTDSNSVIAYKNGDPSSSSYSWVESATGGNNYISTSAVGSSGIGWKSEGMYVMLPSPLATTYAAATIPSISHDSWGCGGVLLLDSDRNLLWRYPSEEWTYWRPAAGSRIEFKYNGGTAYIYDDGALVASKVMVTTPSYVGFGSDVCAVTGSSTVGVDHYTYGSSENKYTTGLPESDDMFILLKDQSNPAASGLAFGVNNTIVQSQFFTGTWSRGSAAVPPEPLANETIHLVNYDTGTAYATNYTGTAYTGDVTIDMQTQLFNAGAPYGRYALTIDGSGQYSNVLIYRGTGATIAFDKDEYQPGDTANTTYTIDGPYWSGTNTYRVDIISGTTGSVIHTQGISLQSGTDTYEFTSDNPQGVYYAVVIANDGTNDIWMGLDYAELNPYLTFTGYVNDENGVVLSGANVNITQNSIVTNSTTIADGHYAATGFYNGASTLLNITKPGYTQYYASLIPPVAKLIPLNFTLVNSTPTYTGLGIGGVARDGILTGIAITFGYGRPISGATVHVVNTTNGEHYTKTTNTAGYYLCDEGASCYLTTKRPYDVWGEKLRYNNSQNYTAVA